MKSADLHIRSGKLVFVPAGPKNAGKTYLGARLCSELSMPSSESKILYMARVGHGATKITIVNRMIGGRMKWRE